MLTYASQGITDKAVAAYNDFQSKYKGDPLGENLPLAMGAAFLTGANPQPDKAIDYLQDEVKLYPKSPLVNQALEQEASALIGLQRYGDALAAYQKFLDTKPPADQAAQAEQGIALIYQQTGKMPDAIRQYQKVADTYPGTAQAEQCAFYAAGLETSVDMKLALLKLQIFVKSYPDGKFTAQALMMTGQAQAALGDVPGAMATYKQVETTYSATDYGPQAYFAQATMLARAEKTDDMVKLMQDFIKVYPNNKDIFYAYDTIGQTQARSGNLAAAVATYAEMADKHPDNPMAATALYRTTDLWRKQADGMGQYQALKDAQRKDWNTDLTNSIAAGEKLLDQFSGSDQVGVDLKNLLADQEMLVAAGLKTPDDVDKYFHGLADKFHSNLGAQSRILFTLATFTYQKDPVTALLQMAGAYRPTLVYAPEDLDLYGSVLIDQGKADEAFAIYQKIANDYPIPQGIQPAQAQPAIQEAQAAALFGMASALDKEGKTTDAAKLYSELKTYYPWSLKGGRGELRDREIALPAKQAQRGLGAAGGHRRQPERDGHPARARAPAGGRCPGREGQRPRGDRLLHEDGRLLRRRRGGGLRGALERRPDARETGGVAQRAKQPEAVRSAREGGLRLPGHRREVSEQPVRATGPGPAQCAGRKVMTRQERAGALVEAFSKVYPEAHCELDFANPLELLVATILSAQCTDKRVNMVTPALFKKYRNARAYADAPREELEMEIQSTGFFRSKAKSLRSMAADLVAKHGGKVPTTMEDLTALRGVGRKTANVVLGNAFEMNEGVVVDTHVRRLSRRLGLTKHTDPGKIETGLMKLIPRNQWSVFSHWLIWHGRRRCQARKPDCGGCEVQHLCPSAFKAA